MSVSFVATLIHVLPSLNSQKERCDNTCPSANNGRYTSLIPQTQICAPSPGERSSKVSTFLFDTFL